MELVDVGHNPFPLGFGIGCLGIDMETYYGSGQMAAVVAVVHIRYGLDVVVVVVCIQHGCSSHTLFIG